MRASIETAYERVPRATADTRIVPAIAVPNEEPRFETLRESRRSRPEVLSGKLDCTTLTEGVSIPPRPIPTSDQSRHERPDAVGGAPVPMRAGARSPGALRRSLPRSESAAGISSRDARRRTRRPGSRSRGGEDHAGLDRAVATNLLQDAGDHEGHSHQQQPLDVLGDERRGWSPVPEQRGRAAARPCRRAPSARCRRRTPARTRPQSRRTRRQQRVVRSACQDARTQRRTCRPRRGSLPTRRTVESGSGSSGSVILRLSKTIVPTTRAWKMNAARQLMPVVSTPPISGPAAAPIPPRPLIDAEGPGPRGDVGEPAAW